MLGTGDIRRAAMTAFLFCAAWPAAAMDFDVSGYGDFRSVSQPAMTDWLQGGLGKFRYGGGDSHLHAQGLIQGDLKFDSDFSAIAVLRADQEGVGGADVLETYAAWHPVSDAPLSWSVKAGAFFPTISLENDDLGWNSPYTLTYSAINSWIGDELRTIGSEGTLRWRTDGAGTFSLMGAVDCCNDPAGILMADRGWAMDDRPTGMFERVRLPDATLKLFHLPTPGRTGLFDEIDRRVGYYGGLTWQMPDVGKISVLRYENQGNPAAATARDTAWNTKFWSFGARTQIDRLVLIGQQLSGYTAVAVRGNLSATKFQSGFLLASYDLDGIGLEDWRASLRGDLFQTRRLGAITSPMNEDGHAETMSLSWQGYDWLRITGEALLMHSRRGEYVSVGVPSGELDQNQFQLDAKLFF
jgi:hypothetical protein